MTLSLGTLLRSFAVLALLFGLGYPSRARGVSQRVVSLPPHLKMFGKREQGSYVPGTLAHESQGSCGLVSKQHSKSSMLAFFLL